MAGICLFCLSTFSVLSISETHIKEVEVEHIDRPVAPMINPPTFKPNSTFPKPSVDVENSEVSVYDIIV